MKDKKGLTVLGDSDLVCVLLGNLVLCPKNIQARTLRPELLCGDPSFKRLMTELVVWVALTPLAPTFKCQLMSSVPEPY